MSKNKKSDIELSEIVAEIKQQGISYVDGAKEYGIKVKAIYDYNYRQKKKAKTNNNDLNPTKSKKTSFTDKEKIQLIEKDNERLLIDSSDPSLSDKEITTLTIENEKLVDKDFDSVSDLPEDIKEIIIKYRKNNPDHGFKRIELHLKNKHFVVVSRKKIRQVLKNNDLLKTLDSSFDKATNVKKGTRRFEAAYPRELYQIDVTYVYLKDISVLYLINIIDDYSRFCVASELRTDQKGTTMIDVLHRTIEHYGKPVKLLTDQGTSFYTWSHESTIFQKYLDDMKIEHIVSDPHSPQTLGKVERLHQTIQRELLHKKHFNSYDDARRGIKEYIHAYNYNRPHQGIEGICPSDRFYGIRGETSRIEKSLSSKHLDFSKGYLIFKNQENTISIINSSKGLQVFIDGDLLKKGE